MNKHGGWSKRVNLLVLAATLAVLATGCGSNDNNGGNSGAAATDTGSGTPTNEASGSANASDAGGASDPIVEITVWDQPAPDNAEKTYLEQQFAKFDQEHPNIKVEHVYVNPVDSREKFMTAVAGGEAPDLSQPAFPDMQVYISKGIAADITDMVNQSPDKERFVDGAFDMATKDGKVYGIPYDMYVSGLLYNKKLFKNAGIDSPPTTWDEFAAVAQKVQEKNPGVIGYDILGMDWADWFFEYYVWQAGGDLTEQQPDGTVKLQFTSDATVKALQFYKDLKWKYKVTQKNVVQDIGENQKDFYTGRSAMINGASDSFPGYVGHGMNPDDLGFAKLPAGPAGVAPSQVGGSFWMLNPKSSPEQQKAAFEYAMFWMAKEQQESRKQFEVDNGLGVKTFTVLKDVDITKYVKDMPQDYLDAVAEAAKDQHLEYYLKSSLSSYIVKPIQKILLDPNADPLTELKAAQELAQKEVIDKYNSDVKSAK